MPVRRLSILLLGSGFAALVYQVAWQRMFRLIFGASTFASAAVIAVFLGGLGAGGAILGKRAESADRPLELYGKLEIGVALSAALTPFIIDLLGAIYFWVGGSANLGRFGATFLRLFLAALAIGPSVFLMGGTLPAAARAAESDVDADRRRLALLYAVNTGGAVLGAMLATFLFLEQLGTRGTLLAAALLNLGIGLVARRLGQRTAAVPGTEAQPPKAHASSQAPRLLVYAAAAVAGLVFLELELVWYRMLGPILGGTSFTFGLILAIALSGIGAGGVVYSAWSGRRPTLLAFALVAALEALAAAFPIWVGDGIAVLATYAQSFSGLGFLAQLFSWTFIAGLVVFPAAVVAGFQFPLLIALLGRGRVDVASEVGNAYAFNTGGAIAGSILGAFVLIPALGAVGVWRLAAFVLAALAVGAAGFSIVRDGRAGRVPAIATLSAALLACGLAAAPGPSAAWRHSGIGAGRAQVGSLDRIGIKNWIQKSNAGLIWEKDGIESSVALAAHGSYAFFINGKSDGSVSGDRGTQVMAGLLPALFHHLPRSAFIVGLGTGMTAGWLAEVETIERVDVAEIEPAVLEVAKAASLANHDVLNHPKVHIFLGDGREFLLTTGETYDVIMSEPSNPYRAGIASLFTEEFYRSVERRLRPNGIFVQWMQGYQIDAPTVRIALRTIRRVLPNVEIWQSQESDFLFVATREKRVIDMYEVRQRASKEPYRTALLRTWLTEEAEGVLARFVASDKLVADIAAGDGPINTDDKNHLEFSFARSAQRKRILGVESVLALSLTSVTDRPQVHGEVDWARVAELRPRALMRSAKRPRLPLAGEEARRRAEAVTAGCQTAPGSHVLSGWGSAGPPRDHVEAFVLARALAESGDDRAADLAAQIARAGLGAEASFVNARLAFAKGASSGAMDLALRTLEELRRHPLSICGVDRRTIELIEQIGRIDRPLAGRGAEALLGGPLAGGEEDDLRKDAARRLAFVLGGPICLQALGQEVEDPEWSDWLLKGRARCLEELHHPLAGRATRELTEFLSMQEGIIDGSLLVGP